MKRIIILSILMSAVLVSLGAQVLRTPPEYSISVPPTQLMFSYYDYMIGGYNATPVQVVPQAQGGGIITLFHGKQTNGGNRKVYMAHLGLSGNIQNTATVSGDLNYAGYPSVDIDEQSGLVFMAWHEMLSGDQNYSIMGCFGVFLGGSVLLYAPMVIFSYAQNGAEYTWPLVKFGPSPNAGMRRIYVVARDEVSINNNTMDMLKIAGADFNPSAVDYLYQPNWSYMPVPEIETWATDTAVYRRGYYSLNASENGNIYLCGYHSAMDINNNYEIDEPNLDVFICGNYGQTPWRIVSVSGIQLPSCMPPLTSGTMHNNVNNSSHFNAVLDDYGNIHFPQLYSYGNTVDSTTYYSNNTYGLRQIVFNTTTETFRIDDLYPQGASPHAEPAYTPWDINEDGVVDQVDDQGNAVFSTIWPFQHWDSSYFSNSMMFLYNQQMMTEPNEQGWMACVWEDSWRALYGPHIPEITEPPYATGPDIYISISPDNGYTWLEPIVLNNLITPELSGMIPQYVYPANKIIMLSHADTTAVGRLNLMFYDDVVWGTESLPGAPNYPMGGDIKFMALDIVLPYTHSSDEVQTPQAIVLNQNYPNPFSGSTTIKYTLTMDSNVQLGIYNVKGQLVKTLLQGKAKSGEHSLNWDGKDAHGKHVSTGLYFYKLQSDGKSQTRKLLLVR